MPTSISGLSLTGPLGEAERPLMAELAAVLGQTGASDGVVCILAEGVKVKLPRVAIIALAQAAHYLGEGKAVVLTSVGQEVTTGEAAELLGVSRPYVVQLLKQEAIAFRLVGPRRRMRLEDVLAYREQAKERQRQALDELAVLTQKMGLS